MIAEYTTDDGREVLIKQTMRYECATQINRNGVEFFKKEKSHIQKMGMRECFSLEKGIHIGRGGVGNGQKVGGFGKKPVG